jgi:hypothetical protein
MYIWASLKFFSEKLWLLYAAMLQYQKPLLFDHEQVLTLWFYDAAQANRNFFFPPSPLLTLLIGVQI